MRTVELFVTIRKKERINGLLKPLKISEYVNLWDPERILRVCTRTCTDIRADSLKKFERKTE